MGELARTQQSWPRTSVGGKPAVYVTRNGGRTWQRQDAGMPQKQAWWTVKRQAMCADASDSVGLYFGTTGGQVYVSPDGGDSWRPIVHDLPAVVSIEVQTLP